ncbi:MAG: hypothetical protein WBG90_04945 [Saonia sp.]
MKPLLILVGTFIIAILLLKLIKGAIDYSLAGRIAMSLMLIFTAMGHFMFTQGMAQMVPNAIPSKIAIVYLSGIFEILLAIGLLVPKYKVSTGWILMLFFILILPANIKASLESINYETGELDGKGPGYLWFRVPLQVLFIFWVYFSTIRE